jgi:hypothetical protein
MKTSDTTRRSGARLLGGGLVVVFLLTGCVDTRSANKAIIEDPGDPGWTLEFDGTFEEGIGRIDGGIAQPALSALSVRSWARVWSRDSSELAVTVLYTGTPVRNRFAAARLLRRFFQIVGWEWTSEFEDVPGSVTFEVAGDSGTDVWVHGGNNAFLFVIRAEGVSHELIGEVFERQLAVLPEYDPFDSIRPGVTAIFGVGMLSALAYGIWVHRDRRQRLEGVDIEVFGSTSRFRRRDRLMPLDVLGAVEGAAAVRPTSPDRAHNTWPWVVSGTLAGLTIHAAFDVGSSLVLALLGAVLGWIAATALEKSLARAATSIRGGPRKAVGVTHSHLFVVSRSAAGMPGARLVASVPLAEIEGVRVESGRWWSRNVWFRLTDGRSWKFRIGTAEWRRFRPTIPGLIWRASGDADRVYPRVTTGAAGRGM